MKTQDRAANASKVCGPGAGATSISFVKSETGEPGVAYKMTYEGHDFVMTDCRDWTNVVVQKAPVQPPAWPVSALNLLKNFHFNGRSVSTLKNWNTASLGHGETRVSTTKDDTTRNTPKPLAGVAFLRLDCGLGCSTDTLYQDIPVTATTPRNAAYTIGAIARTESGSGTLEIALSQVDGNGVTLSTETYLAELSSEQTGCDYMGHHCRKFTYMPESNSGSVILSSDFVSHRIAISLDSRTRALRFTITPKSASAFNLVSAWLMRAY